MKLALSERGAGAPVVLLHGLFGRGRNLAAVQHGLSRNCRAIAPDLRNHGASPHAAAMGYEVMAADLAETLDRLGCGPVALLGHSMGGKVAMAFAETYPDRVVRLLVADIAPIRYQNGLGGFGAAMQALSLTRGMTRRDADMALAVQVPDPAIRAFLLQNLDFGDEAGPRWQIGLGAINAAIDELSDWIASPPRFKGPVLFVAGGRSGYIDAAGRAAIGRQFPGARIETLPNAGHWLHVDDPAGFLALARDFLIPPG